MAIKFEKIQPGMTLFERHRERMGNTTMSRLGEWRIRVVSVNLADRTVTASWNGNPPLVYQEHAATKWFSWSMYERDRKAKEAAGGGK